MAPETVTQDRIYLAVKRDYWDGRFKANERVDIRAIADRHISSPTPVREVLSRFVGERLCEHKQEGGFWPTIPSPSGLRDIYALHRDICTIALAEADPQHLRRVLLNHRSRTIDAHPLAASHAAASFFGSIAAASANSEIRDTIYNLSERLLLVRGAEASVLDGLEQEMRGITRNGLADIRAVIRRRIARYHDRRITHAEAIVESLLQ